MSSPAFPDLFGGIGDAPDDPPGPGAGGGAGAAAGGPPPGTGKSGGGLFSEGESVRIRVLSAADYTTTLCMGIVGVDNKFCTAPREVCAVLRHKTSKYTILPSAISPAAEYAFIGTRAITTLSSKWCIPVEAFKSSITLYKSQKRTFDVWEGTFRQLMENYDAGATTLNEDSLKDLMATSKRLGTPFSLLEPDAKRTRQAEIESCVRIEFPPIDTDNFELSSEAQVGNLQEVVKAVSKTLENYRLKSIDQSCRLVELDASAVDLQLETIKRIIGARNEDTDSRTLVATLEILLTQVREIQEGMLPLQQGMLATHQKEKVEQLFNTYSPSMKELIDIVQVGIMGSLQKLTRWVAQMSDDRICGKLMKQIALLESNIASAGLPGIGNLSLGTEWTNLQEPQSQTGGQELKEALQRIERLENTVKILKEEKTTKQVTLGGTVFQSRLEVAAWLKTHADHQHAPLFFADPASLLALAFSGKGEADGFMSSQATSIKSGYISYQEGLVVHSFTIAIPVVFTAGKSLHDPTLLAGMPTWESFHGKVAMEGFNYTFGLKLDDAANIMMTNASSTIGLLGQSMAHTCIQEAKLFCINLLGWISTTYQELDRSNPNSATDNWKYVTRCVRAIFVYIHRARQVGVVPGVHPSHLMWGCLQGRTAAAEIMKERFSGHSVVQAVLNEHMRSRAVMKEEHMKYKNDVEIMFANLNNEVKALKGRVDKAQKKS